MSAAGYPAAMDDAERARLLHAHWREIFTVGAEALTTVRVELRYRSLARRWHPDRSEGDAAVMLAINVARDAALARLALPGVSALGVRMGLLQQLATDLIRNVRLPIDWQDPSIRARDIDLVAERLTKMAESQVYPLTAEFRYLRQCREQKRESLRERVHAHQRQ